MLGPILASIHNLTFYQRLVARLRDGVLSGRFDAVCGELLERLEPAPDSPG
jgi:queuine/archaeosine tRNA-ribosyltransferase